MATEEFRLPAEARHKKCEPTPFEYDEHDKGQRAFIALSLILYSDDEAYYHHQYTDGKEDPVFPCFLHFCAVFYRYYILCAKSIAATDRIH